ncbi:MAG: hypothetical protein COT43_00895 [Candidatus Marinimicrobia bacterium CG08_land_8_20_14_0_20_45_22]|nr:MAG: hypothetical protein COT43_00895 [Candidatus Marinimicrobia bacterium CG08_land_8_20_14_0_20_45_22]
MLTIACSMNENGFSVNAYGISVNGKRFSDNIIGYSIHGKEFSIQPCGYSVNAFGCAINKKSFSHHEIGSSRWINRVFDRAVEGVIFHFVVGKIRNVRL